MADRAGSNWRLLVHDMIGRKRYGIAHNVVSSPRQGLLPDSPDPVDSEYQRTVVIPNTEFDELVVGTWLHVEAMDTGVWWLDVGGVTLIVRADSKGLPLSVSVWGPGDYGEPVEGCKYKIEWSGRDTPNG